MTGKEKQSYGNRNRLYLRLTNCSLAAILQTTPLNVATVLTDVHFFNSNTQPQFCLSSVSHTNTSHQTSTKLSLEIINHWW